MIIILKTLVIGLLEALGGALVNIAIKCTTKKFAQKIFMKAFEEIAKWSTNKVDDYLYKAVKEALEDSDDILVEDIVE